MVRWNAYTSERVAMLTGMSKTMVPSFPAKRRSLLGDGVQTRLAVGGSVWLPAKRIIQTSTQKHGSASARVIRLGLLPPRPFARIFASFVLIGQRCEMSATHTPRKGEFAGTPGSRIVYNGEVCRLSTTLEDDLKPLHWRKATLGWLQSQVRRLPGETVADIRTILEELREARHTDSSEWGRGDLNRYNQRTLAEAIVVQARLPEAAFSELAWTTIIGRTSKGNNKEHPMWSTFSAQLNQLTMNDANPQSRSTQGNSVTLYVSRAQRVSLADLKGELVKLEPTTINIDKILNRMFHSRDPGREWTQRVATRWRKTTMAEMIAFKREDTDLTIERMASSEEFGASESQDEALKAKWRASAMNVGKRDVVDVVDLDEDFELDLAGVDTQVGADADSVGGVVFKFNLVDQGL